MFNAVMLPFNPNLPLVDVFSETDGIVELTSELKRIEQALAPRWAGDSQSAIINESPKGAARTRSRAPRSEHVCKYGAGNRITLGARGGERWAPMGGQTPHTRDRPARPKPSSDTHQGAGHARAKQLQQRSGRLTQRWPEWSGRQRWLQGLSHPCKPTGPAGPQGKGMRGSPDARRARDRSRWIWAETLTHAWASQRFSRKTQPARKQKLPTAWCHTKADRAQCTTQEGASVTP